jgi:hypothetical protein
MMSDSQKRFFGYAPVWVLNFYLVLINWFLKDKAWMDGDTGIVNDLVATKNYINEVLEGRS